MSKLYLQEKLTGAPGQVVGFDASGKAVAKEDGALLKTGGTCTGKVTFSGGLAVTSAVKNNNIKFLLGLKPFAEGGDVQYIDASMFASAAGAAKVATGSYVGNGNENVVMQITTPFAAKIIWITSYTYDNRIFALDSDFHNPAAGLFIMDLITTTYSKVYAPFIISGSSDIRVEAKKSIDGKTLQWKLDGYSVKYFANNANSKYTYFALG